MVTCLYSEIMACIIMFCIIFFSLLRVVRKIILLQWVSLQLTNHLTGSTTSQCVSWTVVYCNTDLHGYCATLPHFLYHFCLSYCHSTFSSSLPSLFLPHFINVNVDDDNRIVLQPLSGSSDCQKDYINASYVDVCINSVCMFMKINWMTVLHSTQ